ncbi:UNVERIFIED_CONTAM: hypothetical protein Scaly_2842500 [Sesamum calycinum]|uniref:Reverse transcriptase domain-containing protein n=1 Tax=Sesamum calycinum TaxID=2727403 RepID=A0AAW2IS64_9LAMI
MRSPTPWAKSFDLWAFRCDIEILFNVSDTIASFNESLYLRVQVYSPTSKLIFKLRNARFFKDVGFEVGEKVKNIVFEEEYVDIPMGTIYIAQDFIPKSIDHIIDQDNVIEPPPPIQETVTEEQTPIPPEHLPLRRSTGDRRSALPDDYIVFLQEHEVDIGMMEHDLINFHQAMKCSNS